MEILLVFANELCTYDQYAVLKVGTLVGTQLPWLKELILEFLEGTKVEKFSSLNGKAVSNSNLASTLSFEVRVLRINNHLLDCEAQVLKPIQFHN